MFYNKVILCGRVSGNPAIRESRTGKNFVVLRLSVKRLSKRKTIEGRYDNFDLYAYGEIGNSLLEKVKEGDYIVAMGAVGARTYKKKDTEEAGVNMTVLMQKWEFDPTVAMEKEAMSAIRSGSENPDDFEEDVNEETLF